MKKWIFLMFGLGWCLVGYSQRSLKPLDLRTAVLEQYGELMPQDLDEFRWLNKEGDFSHRGESGGLVIRNIEGDTLKLWTGNEVAKRSADISKMSKINVLDYENGTFYIERNNAVYALNPETGVAKRVLNYPADAENREFHAGAERMAYTMGKNVFIATADSKKIPVTSHDEAGSISSGIAIARSEFGIVKGLFWSEDGQKLGFYEMDEALVTDYPLAEYETYPGEATPLKYPMAGQDSQQARVGVFNVETRKTIYLDTQGPRDQYLTNFTFSPDGATAYVVVLNRDQNHLKLNAYNSDTGALQLTLFEEKNDKYVEPERPPVFVDGHEGQFLWFSERDGYDHLYLYEADGRLIRSLDLGDFDVLSILGFANDGNTAVLQVVDGLMGEAVVVADLQKGKTKKITSKEGSYSGSVNPEGGLIMLRMKSLTVPNRLMITDLKGRVKNTLINADNPLADYEVGEIELPVIEAEDGTELQARLIKPYDFDPSKKYPVFVYLYGGPHAQMVRQNSTAGAPLWMFNMANSGYLVFTIDGRGSAHRGLDFEQATFRDLGRVEMKDQLAGVDYLGGLAYADTASMAIHGWSFGGYMTISMMLRHPGVFDVAVAGGPVTNWALYEVMYTERYMDTPQTNPEGFQRTDLRNYVRNLRGDLLIIHGLDDNVVVPQHSYNLLKAFVDEGVQVDFFTYPGHQHNVRGKDRLHLMEKVLGYVDLHLKK